MHCGNKINIVKLPSLGKLRGNNSNFFTLADIPVWVNTWVRIVFPYVSLFKNQHFTHQNSHIHRKAPGFLKKPGEILVAEAGLEPTTSGL